MLSEKGDIPYSPDRPLDESCYREAQNADIFVLIIGGRYGAASSGTEPKPKGDFFERYDSITKREYGAAVERDIPIYILIESNVYSEFRTFLKNRESETTKYAHVDSANIFRLIEEILAKPRNNPVQTFERFTEIEGWLREQWAGVFRELLQRKSNQQQLTELSSEVNRLGAMNETLKKYMETMMKKVSPEEGNKVIELEQLRFDEFQELEALRNSAFYRNVFGHRPEAGLRSVKQFRDALVSAESYIDFANRVKHVNPIVGGSLHILANDRLAMSQFNTARIMIRKPALPISK